MNHNQKTSPCNSSVLSGWWNEDNSGETIYSTYFDRGGKTSDGRMYPNACIAGGECQWTHRATFKVNKHQASYG